MTGHAKKSIYLAGPITGLDYETAKGGWRSKFAALMAPHTHIDLFSPMRSKEFLKGEQFLKCRGDELEAIDNALAKPLGILTRDFNDVTNRDIIVACFLDQPERVSIGTVWEIGVAFSRRKPIIAVMAPGNVHDHIFVTHSAGYVVDSIEKAAQIAASILTPGI